MSTYAELTDEQKADLATYDTFLRGLISSVASVGKKADAETWNQFAIANVDTILAALDDTEVIPNSTGLAGAKPLTAIEFRGLQQIARGLRQTSQANIALITKAIGVNV